MASRTSPLPPLLDRWMREALGGPMPLERRATCADCAMCPASGGDASDDAVFFDPATACCTYMPTLWNFQVGALLADDSPEAAEGRRTVEARLAAGLAVGTLGCLPTPLYELAYRRIEGAFGRVPSMRCPHYLPDGGRCGVWRARESTCATWFCKHERGEVGKLFWERLHQLLRAAERAVAEWVVLELDPGDEVLASLHPGPGAVATSVLTPADFEGPRTPTERAQPWGRWAGRERDFFAEAHARVTRLRWRDVRRLGGVELQALERLARVAYERVRSSRLPARLTVGSFDFTPLPDGGALVTSYIATDPLRLSPMVLAALRFFDGRPVARARAASEAEDGVSLDSALVRRLADFGILVAPETPPIA
ncbi:MAG: hypothetical protein IPK12_23960 [Gemmatimonadetes bacterium]|nr:hypothetical protein [Gemmatimonadota bacterium]